MFYMTLINFSQNNNKFQVSYSRYGTPLTKDDVYNIMLFFFKSARAAASSSLRRESFKSFWRSIVAWFSFAKSVPNAWNVSAKK